MGKVIASVCLFAHTLADRGERGVTRWGWYLPWPGPDGGTMVPCSFPGPFQGVPQSFWGVPPARPGWGIPPARTGMVYPWPGQDGVPPHHVRMGYPPWPDQDGVPPPPQDRAAERALATRRAVCLLRSRRRTFLLSFAFAICYGKVKLKCITFEAVSNQDCPLRGTYCGKSCPHSTTIDKE